MQLRETVLRDLRRIYGRRLTRPLSQLKQAQFENGLKSLAIPQALLDRDNLTARDIFGHDAQSFWFEIGFGNGEHLKFEMQEHPDTAYIGAEPFINGMAAFLQSIADMPKDNIRVHMEDAIVLTDALADSILDGIFILNPDPWPKKRHWKRRIVQPETVEKFVRVLKPGGKLIMTTDIDDLAEWMVTHASNNPNLRWTANTPKDWQTPPPGWVATKYERKGTNKGRKQTYLIFEKTHVAN